MTTREDAIAIWQNLMNRKQPRTILRRGVIGDGNGNVDVEGKPGWVWIRYDDAQDKLSMVRCFLGYIDDGVPVVVGKWHADDSYEQVLGINWGPYSQDLTDAIFSQYKVPAHGDTHHGTYGNDPAYIDYANITFGRVLATYPETTNVTVEYFVYPYGVDTKEFEGGTLDMSGYIPGIVGHKYVLIYFDLDTETLAVANGNIVPLPAPPSVPSLTISAIPLAVVELYNGQSAITNEYIWQHKLMLGNIGGTVAPHTHTSDASGGSSLIGIQELFLHCATSLPMIGSHIWPTDVYHELYVQDAGLYVHGGTLEADLAWIHADPAWGCGQILVIRPAEPGMYLDYRIRVLSGEGNIFLSHGHDVTMSDMDEHLTLIYNGEHWCDLAGPRGREPHIIDADGTLADITTKFNALLASLESLGLLDI